MNKKKYLILGSNGMTGHTIAQYLKEKGHIITGFARNENQICKTIVGDARNRNDIENILLKGNFDIVINCIGILNKFVDEKLSDGIYLNSVFPHILTESLKYTNTKVIHISTDCVYEGTKGAYTELDCPDAVSYYGRSKALGEICDKKNLTLRTSIIGPELKSNGIGLFHWFMNQSGPVDGYKNVIWTGVTTLQLAKAIEDDITKQKTGLYHLVNNETICKYDLLKLFNTYCRKHPIEIMENNTVVSDKSLVNIQKENIFSVPGYRQMIQELAEWMQNHPELYKQYEEFLR